MIGIYAIRNKINGKMYIGQSVHIARRLKDHKTRGLKTNHNSSNYPLYRAIRKYSLNNFEIIILETCKKEVLNEKEIYWIDYYDTTNPDKGYNLHLGGGGSPGTAQKLTVDAVKEIQKLLQETKLSQEEIGRNFNVTYRTISHINTGDSWRDSSLTYPLRIFHGGQNAPTHFCIDCNKKISKGATRCIDCYRAATRKKGGNRIVEERPSRDELKYLIRTKPFTHIGKQYGITDNAIRKWCDGYELPRRKKDIKSYTDEEWDLV